MLLDQETLRYIFGLKLRNYRQDRNLSLKDLAKVTGLSPSYINEIEKGKKYPKSEKIMALAHSLGVSYDDLISIKLNKEMALVSTLLERNLLKGLPFDVFGIPAQMLFDLMAERPLKFTALLGTLLEIARIYNIHVEDFFSATLRAQIDMQGHFFPDLEDKAEEFLNQNLITIQDKVLLIKTLKEILAVTFKCKIIEKDFNEIDPVLRHTHFFCKTGTSKEFYFNSRLTEREQIFVLMKEIGHQFLDHHERMLSFPATRSDSYEMISNNFRASYFAGCLSIPKRQFISEIETFFAKKTWNDKDFLTWIRSYSGTYSSFFYRLSQILPSFFKIDEIFFLRFTYNKKTQKYALNRELHLSELHAPHRVKSNEHYCRRWLTTAMLKDISEQKQKLHVGIQRSRFWNTHEEYLVVGAAFDQELSENTKDCVAIGLRVNDRLRSTVDFLDDEKIPFKEVSDTCEHCGISNCRERVAPPRILKKTLRTEQIQKAIEQVFHKIK